MSEIDLAGSWPEVISQLLARKDLSASHAGAAMRSVLSGEATPSQITAFIVALRAKAAPDWCRSKRLYAQLGRLLGQCQHPLCPPQLRQ